MSYHRPPYYEIIDNIIAEQIPPTPSTGLPNPEQDFMEGNVYLKKEIARLGFTIMTTEEKQGREIHDIIPIQGKEISFSNEGSNYFPFHVEVPHYPIDKRPDAVILFCLRNTPGAKTLIIDFAQLWLRLSYYTKDILDQELFELKLGESFESQEKVITRIMHENGEVTLDMAEMKGRSADAKEALMDIRKTIAYHYSDLVDEVELQPGQMLLFNNKRAIHGRSNFAEHIIYNGTQRWLKRAYLKRSR